MNVTRILGRPLAVLLIGSLVAAGISVAPRVQATARASAPAYSGSASSAMAMANMGNVGIATTPAATGTVTATATTTPTVTTLSVTPTVANPTGLVTVSGRGFAPNETVFIYFTAAPKTVTTAKADATGALPATGVTVPSLPSGPRQITAIGATSKRSRHASVTIQALTPTISLSMALAGPGASVTVTGKGFGAKEQVTVALNGAALSTTPVVITTTNGAFTASFAVPSTILRGSNTVSALGNQSRVSAVAPLQGQLGVAAQFYFAGAMNTATAHSDIALLNGNAQPASAQLTFYFDNGVTSVKTVAINPTSEKIVSAGSFGLPSGTFGLYIKADRQISAQIDIARDGMDGDNLLGNTGLDKRWYLAEGYTGLTFHESVSILNPSAAAPAHVTLHLLPFGGRPGRDVAVTVPAHSNTVADINKELPSQSLSIIADSDQPVVVERTLTFSNGGYGLTTRAGTHTPATSWIFAEGTTVNKFQTFLTVLNPNAAAALVTASFFGRSGGPPLNSKTILVQGRSRANLKLNELLSASGIATVLTSDLPVVVERPEYFGSPNSPGIPGSDVFGRNGAGVRWSFPGGNTKGNSEFLLLFNPSVQTVKVTETFYGVDGKTLQKTVDVPPTVRSNIDVNATIGSFAPLHGTVLQTTGGQGFVAEQTVFAPNHSTLRSTQGLAQ